MDKRLITPGIWRLLLQSQDKLDKRLSLEWDSTAGHKSKPDRITGFRFEKEMGKPGPLVGNAATS